MPHNELVFNHMTPKVVGLDYYQVKFKLNGLTDYNNGLVAADLDTALEVAKILQRSKAVKYAYVVQRTVDGEWVRNW